MGLRLNALYQPDELDYCIDIIFHFSISFFSVFGTFLNVYLLLTKCLVFGSREM